MIFFPNTGSQSSFRLFAELKETLSVFNCDCVQGTLELKDQHLRFSVVHPDNTTDNFDLFAHGGMIFLCTSSSFFCLVCGGL